MPVNTDLTVPSAGGGAEGSSFGSNPLGMVESLMNIKGQALQQSAAQNTIFNQQQDIAAKQRAGELIANSPPGDYDAMIKNLQGDPLVAGRLPDILNSIRTAQNTNLEARGRVLDQNSKAMDVYYKSIAQASDDPTKLPNIVQQNLAALPPDMRSDLAPAIAASVTGLMKGVKGKDPDSVNQFRQNAVGQMLGAGMDPGTAFGAMGLVPPTLREGPYGPGGAQTIVPAGGFGGAGAAGSPQGLTPGAEAFGKKLGEAGGDIASDLASNAGTLPTALRRVDLMVDSLGQFQSGGLASAREVVGKLVQGFRNMGLSIPKDLETQISNGSLPATQIMQSLISRVGVQALKADAQGTGRVMKSEVDRYLDMMGPDQDPKTLFALLNNLKYTMGLGYDQSQKFIDFKQLLAKKDPSVAGMDPSDFNQWYNRKLLSQGYSPELPAGLAPIQPEAIKGASSAKKVYNPKTGGFD